MKQRQKISKDNTDEHFKLSGSTKKEKWQKDYDDKIGKKNSHIKNRSGIEIQPIYGPSDWNSKDT